MRNLRRRIEELEKSMLGTRDVRQAIVESAVWWLLLDDVELLISAFGADRVGRPLTEREAAARESYAKALERECRFAGLHSTTALTRVAASSPTSIGHAILRVIASRFTPEQLKLCLCATETSQTPTEQESIALQAYEEEMERLCQLAGISSTAELKGFQC